jgi:SAM-dependent methyltransferase
VFSAVGRALAGYHHRRIHLPRTRRVAAALVELVEGAGGGASVLDVGCGDGRIARAVADGLGASRVEGVDLRLPASVAVPARCYDGRILPFGDEAFDLVLLSDVLHHAAEPAALLREGLRVARRALVLKDHFCFGYLSGKVLTWMDRVGNASSGVEVTGRYLSPQEWVALVGAAGGRIAELRWPLRIHDLPWRVLTRSELQFAALVEHAPRGGEREARP